VVSQENYVAYANLLPTELPVQPILIFKLNLFDAAKCHVQAQKPSVCNTKNVLLNSSFLDLNIFPNSLLLTLLMF
jgi:hypothetical protein